MTASKSPIEELRAAGFTTYVNAQDKQVVPLSTAEEIVGALVAENERLTGLVRSQRNNLHHEGLISDEEYAALAVQQAPAASSEGEE